MQLENDDLKEKYNSIRNNLDKVNSQYEELKSKFGETNDPVMRLFNNNICNNNSSNQNTYEHILENYLKKGVYNDYQVP